MMTAILYILGGITAYLVIAWVSFKIKGCIASRRDNNIKGGTGVYGFDPCKKIK